MVEKKSIFDSEKQIGILRRYLHILALLQNNKNPENWNGRSLADIIQYEENKFADNSKVMTGKSILDYKDYLKEEFGFLIDTVKGGRRMELKAIPEDILKNLLNI